MADTYPPGEIHDRSNSSNLAADNPKGSYIYKRRTFAFLLLSPPAPPSPVSAILGRLPASSITTCICDEISAISTPASITMNPAKLQRYPATRRTPGGLLAPLSKWCKRAIPRWMKRSSARQAKVSIRRRRRVSRCDSTLIPPITLLGG